MLVHLVHCVNEVIIPDNLDGVTMPRSNPSELQLLNIKPIKNYGCPNPINHERAE